MRLYLAGPMTGLPDHNFPAFYAAAHKWRTLGFDVINPAENHRGSTTLAWKEYMRLNVRHLSSADAIAMLPGWENSRGATLELLIACELELDVFDAETGEKWRPGVTPEEHAATVAATAWRMILRKYMAGQREHGGRLWAKAKEELVDDALEESVDEVVYLLTLRALLGAHQDLQHPEPRSASLE